MFRHLTGILKEDKDKGSRTLLASPLVAAATAIEGKIIDITKHQTKWKNLKH